MLVEIYKNLERYKINFENLFIDNIFSENRNSFLTKAGKKFILTGRKIADSIRNKYFSLNIADPENKYMHERVIRRKIRNILRQKRGKTLFISALLNIVPIEKIKQQMEVGHSCPTIFNYTGDKFVLKRETDIENEKHIIIQSPNWRIKIESRDSRPNLPYSNKNVVKIGYNRANKNGVIAFDNINCFSDFGDKERITVNISTKAIAIYKNQIGILIHINTFQKTIYAKYYYYHQYDVGFYITISDKIVVNTKREKGIEEFVESFYKRAEKTDNHTIKTCNKKLIISYGD
jgi:hypothetical protein